jgi:guanylate kinase
MNKGKLIVITGPSGVGKGTLVRLLTNKYPEIYLSISATTRRPRPGEDEGKAYFFMTRHQFEEMIANNELLEWAEYTGNYYGTPRQKVQEQIDQGKLVLLEIEVVGAEQVKQIFPDAVRIFILPPNLQTLEKRLKNRGTDSEEVITKRLERAINEIVLSKNFEYELINDQLDKTLAEIEAIIFNQGS